ncbi:CHAT domain-containing protein [Bacteroidia bacterium]|nr:CHAT domain-containing protein [Bacteroidia bacterium]
MSRFNLIFPFLISLSIVSKAQNQVQKQWGDLVEKGANAEKTGKHDSALFFFEAAFEIAQEVYSNSDWQLGINAYWLGEVYAKMQHFDKAEKMMLLDLTVTKKTKGKDHSYYGIRLNNLAGLYKEKGQYEKALPLYLEALGNTEKSLGKDHSYYRVYQNNLAGLYEILGQYEKALTLYQEALTKTEKTQGKSHSEYGTGLNNLAGLYENMGQYKKALPLYQEALINTEKSLGKDHFSYGILLNNLALLYKRMGQHKEALPLYQEALINTEKVFGKEHSEYGNRLNNLAIWYEDMGQFDKALPLYQESLKIIEKSLGKHHPRYGTSLNNLAGLLETMGDSEKALSLYQNALINTEKTLGKDHAEYAVNLNSLAGLYENTGQHEKAYPLYQEANQIKLLQIEEMFRFRSEEEKRVFMKRVLYSFDIYQSFEYNSSIRFSEFTETNLNNQLVLKGLLLNASKDIYTKLGSLGDEEINDKVEEIKHNKRVLSKQLSLPLNQRFYNTDSLSELVNTQEGFLVKLYHKKFGKSTSLSKDWKEIKAKLNQDEVAIEFSHFRYRNGKEWTDSTLYAAYLIKKEWATPKVVYLFEQQQLKSVMSHKSPNQLYATRGASVEDNGAAVLFADSIYNLVWKQLEPELDGVKTIYYATDGLLHQIPFAALGQTGSSSLSEQYNMVQLSSTAKLIDLKTEASDQILLVGGIDYTYDTTSSTVKQEVVYSFLENEKLKRSSTNRSRGDGWNYLPGTKTEIEQIESSAAKHKKTATTLSGKLATEAAFKKLNGNSPGVLHIATHGFFFENPKKKPKPESTQTQFTAVDDPLLRSGLLLSGANYTWENSSNPYEKEDGILTALEISNMDLKNTQLVVLSACETGLGDIDGNEGVYGLQRAFKMAGVESIIMSLWQVPDVETSEFMQSFYNTWFTGVSIRVAFNTTQRTMQQKYRDEPFKWAAFVLLD